MALPPPEPRKPRRGKAPSPPMLPISDEEMEWMSTREPDIEELYEAESPEFETAPEDRLSSREREDLVGVLAELAARKAESLAIFEAIAEQERFFASYASERLCLGGNRGGKTTAVMIEIARAVTGQDPYDKYPKTDGIFILVGLDLSHCAKVFYQKLFEPGAFKIIRDERSGEWRTWNPSDPRDLERVHDARKAPPLIPKRFYDEKRIAWDDKKKNVPAKITLKNGWQIWFYGSKSDWPQGVNVDGIAFDEEIEREGWYWEMAPRLIDNRVVDPVSGLVKSGKFLWSATPQAGTQMLYLLKLRADEQREAEQAMIARGEVPPHPTIECFSFGMMENQFLSQSAKDDFLEKVKDNQDEYDVRVLGKFALVGMRVYGEFMPKGVHGVPAFPVPEEWTRYIAVDPGHQICAALFVALPPTNHTPSEETGWVTPGQKVIYDELYVKKADTKIFAAKLVEKVGPSQIEALYIDHRAGRQTAWQTGKTNEEQFSADLKAAKFHAVKTGHGFVWGDDDPQAGIMAVHNGLHIVDGRSEWVVMRDKCPNFIEEAKHYSYKKTPQGVITDEPLKIKDHLMDCWRYLAKAALKYRKPPVSKRALGYTCLALKKKKERAKARGDVSDGSIKVY